MASWEAIDKEARAREEKYLHRRADAMRRARELRKELDALQPTKAHRDALGKGSMGQAECPPSRVVSDIYAHWSTLYDPKAPLCPGLQSISWPQGFKMPQITPYNGKTDPKAFIMSFEAAIQSVKGDEAIMAKIFVMAMTGITCTWYTTLEAGKIFSWE